MMALLHFTTLAITTLFAAGAAALVNWLLLRATFQLMRPAHPGRTTTGAAAGTLLKTCGCLHLNPPTATPTLPDQRPMNASAKSFHLHDHRKKGAIPCWL